ncbi:MAG TPA: hypothetical protein VHV77_07260, partial [Pirellulales bacterium]|nr:hypothetical protein [Pirellulales bacterium]
MSELQRFVRRARRRLLWQRFVETAGWTCAAALLASVVLVAVDKIWPDKIWSLRLEPWAWPALAIGLGLAASFIVALVRSRDDMEAALEIDRRFGLRERVSSS